MGPGSLHKFTLCLLAEQPLAFAEVCNLQGKKYCFNSLFTTVCILNAFKFQEYWTVVQILTENITDPALRELVEDLRGSRGRLTVRQDHCRQEVVRTA